MTIHFYKNDLPDDLVLEGDIAVDTETQGLNLHRDRLCLIQLSEGNGVSHMVHFPDANFDAPNLKRLLADPSRQKILHFARFDVAIVQRDLGITMAPLFCTKIASKLVRTYTDRHGLSNLVKEMLDIDMSKQQQSSDWANPDLSEAQLTYAASDVLYLHRLRDSLTEMLVRENRLDMAVACFEFLPVRTKLDLAGWEDTDIFAHS